ncbi:MAG: polymerase subunit delta [Tepidanaerobacteraceae bacterium]|nr:polymerase subunit delta [Tepidanaerobacteraceae bacterium]
MDNFINAVKAGFVSHAYIFLGSDEVGCAKAKIFAQTVNCENPELAPCGFCKNCRKISNGTHPDFMEISAEGASIKIDQVRTLIQILAGMPMEAAIRVCIVREAHKMTPEAQNALLKTLEEPSSRSTVVLVTDNLKLLLPTIVSRCQVMDFGSGKDGIDVSFDTRKMLSQIMLRAMKDPDFEPGTSSAQVAGLDEECERLLGFLASMYRDILVVKTKSSAQLINDDLADIIGQCAERICTKSAAKMLEKILYQTVVAKSKGNQNLIWYNVFRDFQEVVRW